MQNEISRRGFICAALAIAVVGIDIAGLAEGAEAATGVKVLATGKVEVTVAKVPRLAKIGGAALIGNVRGVPVALVRTSAKAFKAINLTCPHQGATVERSGARWICPRHGSEFAINGAVRIGPAPSSLGTLPIKISAKTVTVG